MATRPARGRGRDRRDFGDDSGIEDTVVKLYRCATVVKGGRRFSFGALVVVGDRDGKVGFGYGKANEVPPAVEKGIKQAKRAMFPVPLRGTTIPHRVIGRFGSSRVVMVPASEGTGVIAGAAPRAVLELAGVKNVLTKCYGSTSPKNLVKATINGLKSLRTRDTVERLRGVKLDLPPEPKPEEEESKRITSDTPRDERKPAPAAAAPAAPAPQAPPPAAPDTTPPPGGDQPSEGSSS
jgi:small subunit ribosomal protein S5